MLEAGLVGGPAGFGVLLGSRKMINMQPLKIASEHRAQEELFGAAASNKPLAHILLWICKTNSQMFPCLHFASTRKSLLDYRWHPYDKKFAAIQKFFNISDHSSIKRVDIGQIGFYSLAAIDELGRHLYYASKYKTRSSEMIYISDPNHNGFPRICLQDHTDPNMNNMGNKTVSQLFLTKKGFLVFSHEGFGLWEFQDNTSMPIFEKFIPLEIHKYYVFLGRYQDKCFFKKVFKDDDYSVEYFDLVAEKIVSLIFSKNELEIPFFLGNYGNKLFWDRNEVEIQEDGSVKKTGDSVAGQDEAPKRAVSWEFKGWKISSKYVECQTQSDNKKWLGVLTVNGEDHWIHSKPLLFPSRSKGENFFLVGDVLVLGYENAIRMIHLSPRQELCTEKLCQLITNALKYSLEDLRWTLFYLKINSLEEMELFIQINSNLGPSIFSMTVPLSADFKNTLINKPEIPG